MITARDLLGGEPVTHQCEGQVALFVGNKKQYDTSQGGPRTCEIYVTPSRLLFFHELPIGWWGHDYDVTQMESVEAGADKTLSVRVEGHRARIELDSTAERDALQTALKEMQAGIPAEPAVSDDRLAMEAKVRTLRKLLHDGKLSQAEYDEQAIQLLGLGASAGAAAEALAQPLVRKRMWRR